MARIAKGRGNPPNSARNIPTNSLASADSLDSQVEPNFLPTHHSAIHDHYRMSPELHAQSSMDVRHMGNSAVESVPHTRSSMPSKRSDRCTS